MTEKETVTSVSINFTFNVLTSRLHEKLDGHSILDVPIKELLPILESCAPSKYEQKGDCNGTDKNQNS